MVPAAVAVVPEYLIVLVPGVNVPVTVNGVDVPVNSKVFAPGANVVDVAIVKVVALAFEPSCRVEVEPVVGEQRRGVRHHCALGRQCGVRSG